MAANAGPVMVLCPAGCGIEIPVPVSLSTDSTQRPLLRINVTVSPVFSQQMEWHMRRFHGGKDDAPLPLAA